MATWGAESAVVKALTESLLPGLAVPIPMRVVVVLATNRLDVLAAFWIWKAVAESAAFLNKAAPVLVKEATVTLLVSRFKPKLSLVPNVTAVPKLLPPCKISPVPPTPAQLPEVRQTVPLSSGRVIVRVPVGLAWPIRLMVPEAAVVPLKAMLPVEVPVTPRVRALPPWMVTVPVKLAADEIVWELMAPDVVTVPILTKLPELSMRWVPAPAPVLRPVVALRVVPVMVLAETKASSVL